MDDLYEVIQMTGEPVRDKDDIEEAITDLKTAMYHLAGSN